MFVRRGARGQRCRAYRATVAGVIGLEAPIFNVGAPARVYAAGLKFNLPTDVGEIRGRWARYRGQRR